MTEILSGGFETPATQSALAFRAALNVMARPGTIGTLVGGRAPAPLSDAAATLLLTLTDRTTGVHLAGSCNTQLTRDWLTFQTGAPLVAADIADFAVGHWADLLPLTRFKIGTPEYPDRSATLICEVDSLASPSVHLKGPGIQHVAQLELPGNEIFAMNDLLFPLGLDLYLTCGCEVAALPRTSRRAA